MDVNGFEIPFLPQSCDPDPAYADAMVEVDYFGRLSGGRTKEGNLRMHFDEAINGIKNADVVTLDPAGRLFLGSDCTAVDACASWQTIDSPMENLSIYRRLMKYGHLQTDPLEEDTSMGGDPAAGTIYRPALDATDWAKFTGPTTALLPRGSSSECFSGSVFDVTCAAPQALTSIDFILSGSFLAGAADKTGRITPDLVHYLNRILKITVATPESAATLNTLPALIRDENGAIAPATPGLPAPANELFVDYAAASYLRSDWFSKSVLVLQESGGVWVPTSVDLMTWLNFINGPMPAAATVLPAFIASTSDALRVVQFIHEYAIPADLWASPAATLTTVSPVTVAYSAVNRNVVLTASVTSQSATPVAGSVMFFVRTAQDAAVGTPVAAAVVNGTAAAAYVLPGGILPQTLSIVASFTPTGPFTASQGTSTLTITQDPASSVIQNGSFSSGAVGWQIYATPDLSYIVSNVTNGVMEFYRVPPPPGESNQAVVFQETGLALAEDAPMTAQFDLGNSSTVRKRISVLILEHDFSDITMCTFTLPANAPLRTYGMRTHSTNAWTNAAIYFYAATEGSDGGFYQIDNVSLIPDPTGPAAVTQCIDPTVPAPGVGADSADLLTNGDFTAGLPPWVLFGQITAQITAGVLEFVRPAGDPAGVILQATDQALPSQDLLTARFSLGNSSTVRKRVTAILHDADFSDLAACTFYLEPGQPLAEHMMYAFTTEPWVNATVSFYPTTIDTEGWMQLDNVSLKRTPALASVGVECMEPAAVAALATTTPAGSAALTSSTVSATGGTTSTTSAAATLPILTARMDDGATDWQATPLFTLSADAAFGGTGLGWSAVAHRHDTGSSVVDAAAGLAERGIGTVQIPVPAGDRWINGGGRGQQRRHHLAPAGRRAGHDGLESVRHGPLGLCRPRGVRQIRVRRGRANCGGACAGHLVDR